jgi:hypothetical protein
MDRPSAESLAYRRFPSFRNGSLRCATNISRTTLIALVSAAVLAGCGRPNADPGAAKVPADPVVVDGDQTTVRVRSDVARDRIWILALDHVSVYDRATRRLIRRIDLPSWSVADRVCQPDIVFDAGGSAFISHNLEPKLWRIRADSFELKAHTLRLVGKEHLDIGFSTLSIASDGTLLGRASTGGSIWRLDLEGGTAHEVGNVRGDAAKGPCVESM